MIMGHLRELNAQGGAFAIASGNHAGTRTIQQQKSVDIVSAALFPPEIMGTGRGVGSVAAAQRLTGFSTATIKAAAGRNLTARQSSEPAQPFVQDRKRARKATAADEEFYYNLIHENCPLVELVNVSRLLLVSYPAPDVHKHARAHPRTHTRLHIHTRTGLKRNDGRKSK